MPNRNSGGPRKRGGSRRTDGNRTSSNYGKTSKSSNKARPRRGDDSSSGKRGEDARPRRSGGPPRFKSMEDKRPRRVGQSASPGENRFKHARPERPGGRKPKDNSSGEKSGDAKKGASFGLPYKRNYEKKGKRPFDSRSTGGGNNKRKQDDAEQRGFFKKSKSRYERKTEQPGLPGTAPMPTEKIRLNRFIANSGVCSRREADELIAMGLISVNGKTITEMGYKVNPGDEVRYENKILKAEKPVYILLNKPKGYLTTTEDPQERNTVMHIIGGAVKERVYPVGRLDRNTTGLLLLTNDGDLADKLMHPSYNVKKIYKVELDRPLTKADFTKIMEGVDLEEGRAMVDDLAIVSDDGKTVGLEIHIGWNRVVRRIFEALEYQVVRLDRSVYAGLDKKDLGRGHWRFLTREEIVRLKHYK